MDQSLVQTQAAEQRVLLATFHEQLTILNGQSPDEAFPDDIDPVYAKQVAFAMCEGIVTIDRWAISARMVIGRILLLASKNIQAYGFETVGEFEAELIAKLKKAHGTLYDARSLYTYLKDVSQETLESGKITNLVDAANEIRRHKGSLSPRQKEGLIAATSKSRSEYKKTKVELGICAEGEESGGEPIILTGLLADTIEYHRWMKDPAFIEWSGENTDLLKILRTIEYCSSEFGNCAESEIWKAVRAYAETRDRAQLVSNIEKAVEMFDAAHPPDAPTDQ